MLCSQTTRGYGGVGEAGSGSRLGADAAYEGTIPDFAFVRCFLKNSKSLLEIYVRMDCGEGGGGYYATNK